MFGLFQSSERKLHRQITRQIKRRGRGRRNKKNLFLIALLLVAGVFFYTSRPGAITSVANINTSNYQIEQPESLKKVDSESQIKIIPTDLALNNDEEIKILKAKSITSITKNRVKNIIKKEDARLSSESGDVAEIVHKTVEPEFVLKKSNNDLVRTELDVQDLKNLEALYLHELDAVIQDQNPD